MLTSLFSKRNIIIFLLLGVGLLVMAVFAQVYMRPIAIDWMKEQENIEISSARISVRDIGSGSPTVIIIPGLAVRKNDYMDLHYALAEHTRVFSYDRPGIGYSSINAEPRTLDYIEKDLVEIIRVRNLTPPFIFIGHSLGGHIIRYYADLHPDHIAGLVFLDHPHEDWFKYVRNTWPQADVDEYFKFWSNESDMYVDVGEEELFAYEKNNDLVRNTRIGENIPVLMYSSGGSDLHYRVESPGREIDQRQWVEMQASLLDGLNDANQIIGWDVGHFPHYDKPELLANEILKFIEKIREIENIQ